jgi:hypothetical protein
MPKMNVNAFLQKDYENEPPSGPKKQTQFKACPERSRMGQFLQSPKSLSRKSGHTFIFSCICLQLIACLKWGLGYIIKVPAAHLKKDL